MEEKLTKLRESRAKLVDELEKVQVELTDAVQLAKRKVVIERLIVSAKDVLTKAVAKNDAMISLVTGTDQETLLVAEFEEWLNKITVKNDEVVASARKYSNTMSNECSVGNRAQRSHHSAKPKSCTSQLSKASSQCLNVPGGS